MKMKKQHKKFRLMHNLIRCRNGNSTVEFAVTTPVLLVGLVATIDVGLAIDEHMTLDQAVRSGVEFVMDDVTDEETLEKYVVASALGFYDDVSLDVSSDARPTATVTSSFTCDENPDSEVKINTLCQNDKPASIHYTISAFKTYEGMFIPDIPLNTSIDIQVR